MRDDFIDLTGSIYGYWKVLEYKGDKRWECECTCGKIRILRKYDLTHLKENKCPHINTYENDLSNQKFGEWEVLKYNTRGYWICKCSCGEIKSVKSTHLLSGASKSCGHATTGLKDLSGMKFGEWKVIEYAGNLKWKCICSCGMESLIYGEDLRSGQSKSCGHGINEFIDLTGKEFGNWVVIEYAHNSKWLCECQCSKHTLQVIGSHDLRQGKSLSCGCEAHKIRLQTLMRKYGEIYINPKSGLTREKWQLEALHDINKFRRILESNERMTPQELGQMLGVTISTILKVIHKFELEDLVNIYRYSNKEQSVYEELVNICRYNIIRHDRKILNGKELDFYIPDKRLAIEFNGNYWHCDGQKDKLYHQQKTIECIKNKIRLIHIFEYEWDDDHQREKIKRLLKDIIVDKQIIYARNTELVELKLEESRDFEEEYHLQGYAHSSIKIGLKYNEELVAEMTFGVPRFNKEYQYEMVRLCFKPGISITGGSEKMLKHFIDKYKPESIISYCNLSKFDGNGYIRLGFKTNLHMLTEPNYIWFEPVIKDVLKRYQTQKQKLLDQGLGELGNTEDEIMDALGYLKIYDCGNMKFEWNNQLKEGIKNG